MTSKLRPAAEVATEICGCAYADQRKRDIAVIEADREAVRAEQATELAKFKALAETLAGALEKIGLGFTIELDDEDGPVNVWMDAEELSDLAREALREYKEARDDQ